MTAIRFPEFLDSLENTKYPFTPTAALSNGKVSFLEGTFLDAHVYATTSFFRYYISAVVVESGKFTIHIGDEAAPRSLYGEIDLPIAIKNVQLQDDYGRPAGILVSNPDRLAVLATWGIGTHTFERGQTEFCVTCQMPIPNPGVSGFLLETGEILSGKVWFVGDDGVVVSIATAINSQNNLVSSLQVNAIGDPLYLQRLCNPSNIFTPVNPVRILRVVNGENTYDCLPDVQGNFNLQMNDDMAPDAALRIRTTAEGIIINVEGSTT